MTHLLPVVAKELQIDPMECFPVPSPLVSSEIAQFFKNNKLSRLV